MSEKLVGATGPESPTAKRARVPPPEKCQDDSSKANDTLLSFLKTIKVDSMNTTAELYSSLSEIGKLFDDAIKKNSQLITSLTKNARTTEAKASQMIWLDLIEEKEVVEKSLKTKLTQVTNDQMERSSVASKIISQTSKNDQMERSSLVSKVISHSQRSKSSSKRTSLASQEIVDAHPDVEAAKIALERARLNIREEINNSRKGSVCSDLASIVEEPNRTEKWVTESLHNQLVIPEDLQPEISTTVNLNPSAIPFI